MTDMIEPVARAIFNAMADFSGEPRPTDAEWNMPDTELAKFKHMLGYAAIKAMREPTAGMSQVGVFVANTGAAIPAYEAMIDAALGDKK